MAEQERARCPACGDADSTVNLRAWRAEMEIRIGQARDAAAINRRATAQAARRRTVGGSGSGGSESALELGDDVLVGLIGLGLRAAWRKLVWNPFKERALPALAGKNEEISHQFSATINRHPELWMCPRDQVVFRAVGGKTVLARDAMRWLGGGDDVKLMAALDQN